MTNDNLSEIEIKFIKNNFGSLKIPKNLQKEFIQTFHISLKDILMNEKSAIKFKNWFNSDYYLSFNKFDNEFEIYKYDNYNNKCIKIVPKEKWMKIFSKTILKFVKEKNNKDNNKKFIKESVKILNDISNLEIDEPLNIQVIKQNNYLSKIDQSSLLYKILSFIIGFVICQLIARLIWLLK